MLRTHLVSVITLLSASALGIAGDDFAGKWVNTEKIPAA